MTIFGDIHGQFYDMLNIFESKDVKWDRNMTGKMVFLGDYVDRGPFGVEVFLLLLERRKHYAASFCT